ncbi:MAG TPA: DUF1592 domain-containing protein, partial [Polyangiaceae bacterium]|nr:DUF1592 domain-containing protein [Polyangiaceae bacterium]
MKRIKRLPSLILSSVSLALALGCQAEIVEPAGSSGATGSVSPSAGSGSTQTGMPGAGASSNGSAADTGSIGGGSRGGATSSGGSSGALATGGSVATDVNRVPIHRLNNAEYNNTLADLLGITSKPAAGFIDDEKLAGFDTIAAAFGMTDARYEQYFDAADTAVEQAFADATLRDRILVCKPADATDPTCARQILSAFVKRAYRRPIQSAEIDGLLAVVSGASALGEDFAGSIRQALKAVLSSAEFLYRVEFDAEPSSPAAHPLSAHELGSRLSYLVWSTLPDTALIERADRGDLSSDAAVAAELDRLLADPRSARFVESFAGQWLGLRQLGSHQVDASLFPDWNETLRAAMVQEGLQFFTRLLRDQPISEFFTSEQHSVNAPLAKLYGLPAVSGDQWLDVSTPIPGRRGFMGLAGFLTLTSFSKRTAPTLRGKWVLENLLCNEVPAPPANVPELDKAESSGAQSENVRARLEEHRKNPSCAGCHQVLDPIGLGLENFDAIGRYRTAYTGGEPVDASGQLP